MKFHSIRTLEELMPYLKIWNHILEVNQNTNPFIEFPWVENWWKYLGKGRDIEIIVIEKNEDVMGFFPFQFTRTWDSVVIEFIGRGEANYMDFIVYDDEREETIKFVFNELMGAMTNYIFNLHGLLSSSPSTNMLSIHLAKINCEPTISSVVTPFIDMGSVDLNVYMKKRRKIHGLDRREKRLRHLGEVRLATCTKSEMNHVFAIHDKHWEHRKDTSQFTEAAHKNFYTALLNVEESTMQAKVECLYLDDQILSFSYGYICRGRYLGYIIGHDDDYGIYGPGTILDKELIVKSQIDSILNFDLSIGYEPYKFEWSTGVDYTNNFMFSSKERQTHIVFQLIKSKRKIIDALKQNYKNVLFVREFIGGKMNFIKRAKPREWFRAIRKMVQKIYSSKSIDVYQQSEGNDDKKLDFQLLVHPEVIHRQHDVRKVNKRFYNGFSPYSDHSLSMFWVHPKSIRVDEVGLLEPLPKHSAFIVEWQTHKLAEICSFLRRDKKVKEIFLYTSKQEEHVKRHLQQLGFKHVKSAKRTNLFFKFTKQVTTYPIAKE